MNANPHNNESTAQALALWKNGRREESLLMCERLASRGDADALGLLAEIYGGEGRPRDAVECLRRLVFMRPADAGAHRRLGNALLAVEAYAEATSSYQGALVIEPDNIRAHNNLGRALVSLGRVAQGIASYQRALELEPRYAIAHNNLGIAYYECGEYEASLASYRRALELEPSFAEARNNCGNVLLKLDRAQEALECYEEAMALRPALFNHGKALQELGRFEAAVDSYRKALRSDPNHAEALSNCASALLSLHRPEEALRCCERALAIKSDFPEAYNNLGGALRRLSRNEEALAACETALQLKPDYVTALTNLASITLSFNLFDETVAYCDRAIAIEPLCAEAYEQKGAALLAARQIEAAVLAYTKVCEIEPDRKFAAGMLLNARLSCCDWTGYYQAAAAIEQGVAEERPVIVPFTFLAVSGSPELHLKAARILIDDQIPAICRLPWSGARHKHDRIRIAYLSADYRQHATALLMAGLFEAHDRDKFETIAISFGRSEDSPLRQRVERAFDRFIDVQRVSDSDVAQMMRSLEVDIAIDLKGYTGEMRPGILSRRCAPVQVNYLGYPGTMGLTEIDYLIADPVVLPAEQAAFCTERIVYLPECYQVNDDRRPIDDRMPARAEVGLPEAGFVFCCFNNSYKITPAVFDIWMRLLRAVPGSVLWLLEDNVAASRNLRREAVLRDVSAERLIFAPRLPSEQHLARQRLADLFLDTLPYNAHTTSSDALWAGLPVLTCLGNAFPGRVAASLLYAVGLPELVTGSLEEYFERGRALATAPAQLAELRTRLAHNRKRYPLFNTARFCRHLEDAYAAMWQRYEGGLAPETFSVSPRAVTET